MNDDVEITEERRGGGREVQDNGVEGGSWWIVYWETMMVSPVAPLPTDAIASGSVYKDGDDEDDGGEDDNSVEMMESERGELLCCEWAIWV